MKISVLTSTYNRGELLEKLYQSLLENSNYGLNIEWLIMDDGSTDNTKTIIQDFQKQAQQIEIKYFYQENSGKMLAINNLVEKATGDLIVDCDSDDYFTKNAFEIIKKVYDENKDKKDIYGFCFLKYDENGKNMGNNFKNNKTTMFDLYFKEGETGEKAIVFLSDVRKKYRHKLEKNERFVTEARMYHEMDLKYRMICVNSPIMICEYQENGYTKNIQKEFKENPYGYYEYFKEILERDMQGVTFKKRLYVIKHYILFKYLTKTKGSCRNIKGALNKILYLFLYIPGVIITRIKFKNK